MDNGAARSDRFLAIKFGRADDFEAVEFIAHQSPVEATIAERGDTTVVASARSGAAGRLGSHAIAALFVILLTAFGTFCRYYPWKMPATAAPLRMTRTGTRTAGTPSPSLVAPAPVSWRPRAPAEVIRRPVRMRRNKDKY